MKSRPLQVARGEPDDDPDLRTPHHQWTRSTSPAPTLPGDRLRARILFGDRVYHWPVGSSVQLHTGPLCLWVTTLTPAAWDAANITLGTMATSCY